MAKELTVITGRETEWMVEWQGGHAVSRGVTAFEAHSRVCGAPAFGECAVWQWSETKAEVSK